MQRSILRASRATKSAGHDPSRDRPVLIRHRRRAGDFDGDGTIGILDLTLLANWGPCA
ncbi:MAG: hypothetical protein IH983_13910 [Planctomycetes bacterium]|nr:hypothetical protein [Planctomycetota bacterium]